jgi:hypothetical protein
MYTHLYFQCKRHKKELQWNDEYHKEIMNHDHPVMYTPIEECVAGGFDVRWDRFRCRTGDQKCIAKWRVIIVEKRPPNA